MQPDLTSMAARGSNNHPKVPRLWYWEMSESEKQLFWKNIKEKIYYPIINPKYYEKRHQEP